MMFDDCSNLSVQSRSAPFCVIKAETVKVCQYSLWPFLYVFFSNYLFSHPTCSSCLAILVHGPSFKVCKLLLVHAIIEFIFIRSVSSLRNKQWVFILDHNVRQKSVRFHLETRLRALLGGYFWSEYCVPQNFLTKFENKMLETAHCLVMASIDTVASGPD